MQNEDALRSGLLQQSSSESIKDSVEIQNSSEQMLHMNEPPWMHPAVGKERGEKSWI